MIDIPDFEKAWKYENSFYLTCSPDRIGKILTHYELFKRSKELPGAIVECGVFKGASLARFSMFRKLFGSEFSKKLSVSTLLGSFQKRTITPIKITGKNS